MLIGEKCASRRGGVQIYVRRIRRIFKEILFTVSEKNRPERRLVASTNYPHNGQAGSRLTATFRKLIVSASNVSSASVSSAPIPSKDLIASMA